MIDHRKQFCGEMIALLNSTFFRWSLIWNSFFQMIALLPMIDHLKKTISVEWSSEESAGQKSNHLPAKLFPMIDHLATKLIQMSDHLTARQCPWMSFHRLLPCDWTNHWAGSQLKNVWMSDKSWEPGMIECYWKLWKLENLTTWKLWNPWIL